MIVTKRKARSGGGSIKQLMPQFFTDSCTCIATVQEERMELCVSSICNYSTSSGILLCRRLLASDSSNNFVNRSR